MKEVFIVDEEPVFSRAIQGIVRFNGHIPVVFKDASSSLGEIVTAMNERRDAVYLIDITLAGGSDTEKFGARETESFSITGLALVKEVIAETDPSPKERRKIILYTANHLSTNWDRIRSFSLENGCRYWKKDVNANIDEIIAMIEDDEDGDP